MGHNLPEEIIHDILSRLPPKSLIRCTLVCKAWRSTIKNPSFIPSHLNRTIYLNNQFGTHLLLLHCVSRAILSSSVNIWLDEPREKHCNLHYDNHAFDEYCKLEFPIIPNMNKFLRVVGVCNGLVCLAVDNDRLGYIFMLCNPSIRKSVTLPKPHLSFETIGSYDAYIGFGFDAVTNDYKVVRLITEHREEPNTFYEVYSLAGGYWSDPRSLDHVCEVTDPHKPPAFVNGAIHFKAFYRSKNGGFEWFILAFDVGSNTFRRIMAPTDFAASALTQLSISGDGKSIAIFNLCQSFLDGTYLDIWVMKEYGMEESWTKLTTPCPPDIQREIPYKPLCFRKSGDVVLVPDGHPIYYGDPYGIVSLDPVSKQFKSLGFFDCEYYYVESYVESLVLLDKADTVSY
ncbi:hypothetical protein DVH24_038196 [Malus domestica]|uniref:F-box domain-containing protein n=1 Tax=Malus domestica TaxID=3750 RepID=A0A498KEG0_MALDO|nr:hypothetical protein DVH24_038196 [Malus domestica]